MANKILSRIKILIMAVFKVSKDSIDSTPIDELGGLAHDVSQSMFELNTSTFTGVKPITETAMGIIITAFNDKRGAYKQGGLAAKRPYEIAHTNLLACLYLFIGYVNEIADGNEDILKLSKLPYSDGTNTTAKRVQDGELADELFYVPGANGTADLSCAFFGKGAKYITIVVKGLLPDGVSCNMDGQLSFPDGVTMPPHSVNINGKRNKKVTGMLPKTDYHAYYLVLAGGYVSAPSAALKIGCLN